MRLFQHLFGCINDFEFENKNEDNEEIAGNMSRKTIDKIFID